MRRKPWVVVTEGLAMACQMPGARLIVQTAMAAGLPYTALRDAILTHPTMAEGLNTLFSGVSVRAGG